MTEMIENKTFDEIRVGDTASLVRAFRQDDVETWAAVTGNLNLIDLDPSPVDSSMFPHGAGQAMWAAALFSTIAGTRLPGLGSVTTAADIQFLKPVPVGQRLTVTVTVREKREDECDRRPRLRLHRRERPGAAGRRRSRCGAARRRSASRCATCRRCSCAATTATSS